MKSFSEAINGRPKKSNSYLLKASSFPKDVTTIVVHIREIQDAPAEFESDQYLASINFSESHP